MRQMNRELTGASANRSVVGTQIILARRCIALFGRAGFRDAHPRDAGFGAGRPGPHVPARPRRRHLPRVPCPSERECSGLP